MDIAKFSLLAKEGHSSRSIANQLITSQTNVRYWAKKLKIKLGGKQWNVKPYKCQCGETNSSKFSPSKKNMCKQCHSSYTVDRAIEMKRRAVESIGGKCLVCSYKKYVGAIEFHHLDRSLKSKNFRTMKFWSWEKVKNELKNCVPLCRNCHAEAHAGIVDLNEHMHKRVMIL